VNKTQIEWVRNPDGSQGFTLNSKTGCTNHTPEGLCLGGLFPCYADKLAHGRLKPLYLANENISYDLSVCNIPHSIAINDPFYPRFWEEKLKQPYQRKKPAGIFLDDMSDWMGDCWPREWTLAELQMMRENPQHRFYTLTKQPQRLPEFSPFPEKKALHHLFDIEAKVRFISFEPLLGKLDIWARSDFVGVGLPCEWDRIGWLIIGACTGSWVDMANLCMKHTNSLSNYAGLSLMQWGNKWTAQPSPDWVREIVEAADKAGVRVFLKENLMPLFKAEGITSREDWTGIRQEMPK